MRLTSNRTPEVITALKIIRRVMPNRMQRADGEKSGSVLDMTIGIKAAAAKTTRSNKHSSKKTQKYRHSHTYVTVLKLTKTQ